MDMDSVCRVCIVKAVKCTPLNTKIEVSSSLSCLDFLNNCTNLSASENDKLPQSLCPLCASSLKTFYSFVKLAEKSNIILKETWKNLQQQCNEAPRPPNIPCSGGSIDNDEISCEEIAIKNEKIEEEFEDFRKENSFHCQTNENSSGLSLYILDIVKEEACVSDGTSIVHTNNSEIKERETSKSNLNQPKRDIEVSEDISSYIDDYLTSVDAKHSYSKDNLTTTLLKRELIKIENGIDVQSDDGKAHCIPFNMEKKTEKTDAESEGVIKGEASNPQSENTNKCKECDFDINDREEFATNYRDHVHEDKQGQHLVIHKETKQYNCSICGKGFIHLSCRSKHMQLHGKNPYECEICGQKLRNKSEHKLHMRKHSNIKFTCSQCGRVYKSKKYLLSHINSHASNQPEYQVSSKDFSSKKSITFHKENHITEKCDKCDQEFENLDALSKHMKLHKMFKCEKCGKIFYIKRVFDAHMHKHNGNKIKCQQCGKEFKYRYNLCRHMKRHDDPKPYKCGKCGETFHKKYQLNVHMENHTGFRKKCDQCGKEFKHRCSLDRHMKQHTNPKQLEYEKCSLCSKQFRSKHNLKVHMENHKGITKTCDQCSKVFKNSDALRRHMKLHTKPFKCEKCGEIFTRRYRFNFHMESHKGVKKKCQQCDREFKNIDHLRRHMKWHVDPTPFKCNNCGKLLSRKDNYLRHMEICQPVGNSFEEAVKIEESSVQSKGNKDIVVNVT